MTVRKVISYDTWELNQYLEYQEMQKEHTKNIYSGNAEKKINFTDYLCIMYEK